MIRITGRALARIEATARAARPREACGLLVGADNAILEAVPTENLAQEDDRFEIDARAHIALVRRLRGSDRAIIGVFHSHPNGSLALSPRDCQAACYPGWLWLLTALGPGERIETRAFRHDAPGRFTALGQPVVQD